MSHFDKTLTFFRVRASDLFGMGRFGGLWMWQKQTDRDGPN